MTIHVDNKLTADQRILRARTDIVLSHRFYGVLVANVEPVLSRKFPTAATNGKQHFFNPDFVDKLTRKELNFVQRHESEHDARHHSTRRGGRDAKEWNICCDFAINIDLVDEIARGADMEVPREEILGGKIWVDAKYRGMSAEDIYRSRELDRQKAEQEKAKQQAEKDAANADKEDDANDDVNDAGNEDSNGASDEPEKSESEGSEDGDTDADKSAGDEAGDEAEDSAVGDKAGKAESSTGESEAGDDASEGEAEGGESDDDSALDGTSGQDRDSYSDTQDRDSYTVDDEGDEEGEASVDAEPESVTGEMPGGLGEVLDATDDPAEVSEEEAKWERVVRQAASIAKKAGDLPGHITREIERANQPKQNWRETLRAYFDQGASLRETWNRPNRRFIGTGTILPGSQREGLNSVVFLIDTSGSCDDVALAAVSVEAQAALDEGIIDNLTVVYGDVRVTRADEYVAGDEIEFDPKGGGGTRMKPLFDWAKDNVDNPSLVVCFTDLEIEPESMLGERPACPVLWAVHGYPESVRRYIADAPWGEPGIDVGSH